MQKDEHKRSRPDARVPENRGPETRTTASAGRFCEHCGRPLTGRKERFCSDRCRMAVRREHQRRRRLQLLNAIGAAVEELRRELTAND
jgi:predicted nucleic acid-binding Zn ribbon protein